MSELDELLARFSDRAYWESLNPHLSIDGPVDPPGESPEIWPPGLAAEARDAMLRRGYCELGPLLSPQRIARLLRTIDRVQRAGWLPVFSFLYDELWTLARATPVDRFACSILDEGYRQVLDFWISHLPRQSSAHGFLPHPDRPDPGLLPNGMPPFATFWIPITDATINNGCIYVVPRDLEKTIADDRELKKAYGEGKDAERIGMLHRARALPAKAGSLLSWNNVTWHWGSFSSAEAARPRISISLIFIRGDVDRNFRHHPRHPVPADLVMEDFRVMDPAGGLPDFEQRLFFVARSIQSYHEPLRPDDIFHQLSRAVLARGFPARKSRAIPLRRIKRERERTIADHLPAVYRNFLPAFFESPLSEEKKATCDECAMCDSAPTRATGVRSGPREFFDPDVKCCTFHPQLPNYLVGALLSDEDPGLKAGRARIGKKIKDRMGVTPAGIRPPAAYDLVYKSQEGGFGRASSLLCPYYQAEGGLCSVWKYREAVCSTWYCKFVKGFDGKLFWETLKRYLETVQAKLHAYALLQVDPELFDATLAQPANAKLTLEDLERLPPDSKRYAAQWKNWEGREEEFFRRCHDAIARLTPEEFERIVGIDGKIAQRELERRYREAVRPTLPERLVVNPSMKVESREDEALLVTYSTYDPTVLSAGVFEIVKLFDGKRTNEEVRAACLKERNVDFDDSFIESLYHQRILVPVSPAEVGPAGLTLIRDAS